jgi:hypothetical protein
MIARDIESFFKMATNELHKEMECKLERIADITS